MRNPMMKYRGLKFLTILALVIAACAIAVAENGNSDSNEVATTLEQCMLKTISVDFINTPIEDQPPAQLK